MTALARVPSPAVRAWWRGLLVFGTFSPLVFAGCKGADAPITVKSIVVSPASGTVEVDKTLALSAIVNGSNGKALTDRVLTWSSGSPSVASVDASGTIRGLTPGASIITVTSGSVSGLAAITVIPKPVASVVVTPPTSSIIVAQTAQLSASTRASDGTVLTGRTVVWSSANSGIASVNPTTGLVTGVGAGSATITATSEGVTGTATVQVSAPILLTGTWSGVNLISGLSITIEMTLNEGATGTVTGTTRWVFTNSPFTNGAVTGTRTGSTFSLTTTFPGFVPTVFTGTIDQAGNTMTGLLNGSGFVNVAVTVRRTGTTAGASRGVVESTVAPDGNSLLLSEFLRRLREP